MLPSTDQRPSEERAAAEGWLVDGARAGCFMDLRGLVLWCRGKEHHPRSCLRWVYALMVDPGVL